MYVNFVIAPRKDVWIRLCVEASIADFKILELRVMSYKYEMFSVIFTLYGHG